MIELPKKSRRVRRLMLLLVGVVLGAVLARGAMKFSTGPAEGTTLSGAARYQASAKTLRLGTFNIDGGMGTDEEVNLNRTASCLQHLDFIGLNEVHGSFSTNQAAVLSEKLQLPFLYAPAERQWWHESFGNAIFTDLPVQHWSRIVLPSEAFRAKRNYVLTDVSWNGKTVHILTTHTDWKSGGAEQLRIVSDLFLSLPEPAVLMGDLNTPRHDPQLRKLLGAAGVEEAIDKILGDDEHPRVDWIFLRGLTTVDAGAVDFGASDHPAFWAEVKVNVGRNGR